MNKAGQVISIIFFVATIVTFLLLAPILLKIVILPSSKFSDALSTIDATNKSVNAVDYTITKFTQAFDWVVFFFMLFSIMLLLISSFLVDAHPAFFVIYFIAMFMMMIFAPMTLDFLDKIYNGGGSPLVQTAGGWAYEIAQLPITNFVYEHFALFILGIMFLSGIIMYGKYRRSATSFY